MNLEVINQLIKYGQNSYGIRAITGAALSPDNQSLIGNFECPKLQAMEVMRVVGQVDKGKSDGRTQLWQLQQVLKVFNNNG